jgi:hypothetical protein
MGERVGNRRLVLEPRRWLVRLLALLQEHGDRLGPIFRGPEHAVASPLVYLVPQAANEILPTPAEQQRRAGGSGHPVIALRNTVQQLVGGEESLVAKAWMLVWLAFEGFGYEADGQVAVRLAQRGGGHPFGLLVV